MFNKIQTLGPMRAMRWGARLVRRGGRLLFALRCLVDVWRGRLGVSHLPSALKQRLFPLRRYGLANWDSVRQILAAHFI